MSEQTFINDVINTKESDYLTAIRVLLKQNGFKDNFLDIIQLLLTYNLPDSNILNITSRFIDNESFDVSTYEYEG